MEAAIHNDAEMKRKGDEPTTRKDLWALETALRKDMGVLETGLRKDMGTLGSQIAELKSDSAETKKVVRNIAAEMSRMKADNISQRESDAAARQRETSRIIDHMDGFMSKTLKVGSEQSWGLFRAPASMTRPMRAAQLPRKRAL